LFALASRRNLLLLAGFLVALALVSSTNPYRLRVLYLLPYFYLAVSSLFYEQHKHRAATWAIGLMLLAGAGFTVAGTTLSGWAERWAGSSSIVSTAAGGRESPSHCSSNYS